MKCLIPLYLIVLLPLIAEPEIEGTIPKVTGKVAIDGVLDDAIWKKSKIYRGDYIQGKVGQLSNDPRLEVRYAWDSHYLYIGYETFDHNLIALKLKGQQGPADNRRQNCAIWHPDNRKLDVVEFFITFGNEHFFWELHHNARNDFSDVLCLVNMPGWEKEKPSIAQWKIYFGSEEFIQDEGPYKLERKVKLKANADGKPSTIGNEKDTDSGYTAELRLPWLGLGAPLSAQTSGRGPWQMAGRKIRLLAVVQDGDLKQRYHHSGSVFNDAWFHHGVKSYPVFKLGGKNTPVPKAK